MKEKKGRKDKLTAWKLEHGAHSSVTTNSSTCQHGKFAVLTKRQMPAAGLVRNHSSQRFCPSDAPAHLRAPPHVLPTLLGCALGKQEGVNTNRNTHVGGVGSPDRHPPDCLSSRTGAWAWLVRGKGGKSQKTESRAAPPSPGAGTVRPPVPPLPELQGESAEHPAEGAARGEATPPGARRHGALGVAPVATEGPGAGPRAPVPGQGFGTLARPQVRGAPGGAHGHSEKGRCFRWARGCSGGSRA